MSRRGTSGQNPSLVEMLVRLRNQNRRLRREKILLLDIAEYARTSAELYGQPDEQGLIERRLGLIKRRGEENNATEAR